MAHNNPEFPFSIIGTGDLCVCPHAWVTVFACALAENTAPTFDELSFFPHLQNVMQIASDSQMETAVDTVPGAIGFVADNHRVTARQIHLFRDGNKLEPDLRSQRACLSDTFNATSLRYSPTDSKHADCWPLTMVLYSAVMRENTLEDCSGRKRGLNFLKWWGECALQ